MAGFGMAFRVAAQWTGEADSRSRRIRAARIRGLRSGAAYLWRVARNSIKEGRRRERHTFTDDQGTTQTVERWVASQPGRPPFQHGSHWKDSFRFAVDEESLTAYVGPVRGHRGIAPIHEFGTPGVVRWTTYRWTGYRQSTAERHEKIVSFQRRPTMGPALERSRDRLAGFWKNVVSS